jgi:sulfur dioxygenase
MRDSPLVRQLFERESCTYSYLVAADGEALIIDPVKEQLPQYLQLISELGLTLRMAIDTHVHADHVTALGVLRDQTGCTTVMGKEAQSACVSRKVEDGEVLLVGPLSLEVMYTPGHTDDSYCFLMRSPLQARLFTGDTLLIRGSGRTDFQNGDAGLQYDSLQRLMALPDETLVCPAHDYKGMTESTIYEERTFNPRWVGKSRASYIELMQALKLPSPKLMDIAVPQNRACGLVQLPVRR